VPGISLESAADGARFRFLERQFRIRLVYIYEANAALQLEDISIPSQAPQFVDRVAFSINGDTTFDGGVLGGKLNISTPGDAIALALMLILAGLKFDPWKSTRTSAP
jgi:hypothetical protein